MFRKFANKGSDEEEIDEDSLVESDSADKRPLTRSSIKPRLLFPGHEKAKDGPISLEDEEADTDIEDHIMSQLADEKFETPAEAVDDMPGTPNAPKFAPASPLILAEPPALVTRPERKLLLSSLVVASEAPSTGGAGLRTAQTTMVISDLVVLSATTLQQSELVLELQTDCLWYLLVCFGGMRSTRHRDFFLIAGQFEHRTLRTGYFNGVKGFRL